MKVYVDGQEYTDLTDNGCASSVLEEVKRRVSKAGRIITEVRLDGVVMDEEAFSGVSGGLAAHFTSHSVHALVLESLDEALRYIPRLTGGFEEIALHFEKNELTAGEGKLADGADGLDWLLNVFQKSLLLLAINDAGSDGFDKLKDALAGSISALGTLHSEKKHLQMAFCIRQKLVPDIEKFSMYVQKLRDLAFSTQ